MEILNSLSSSVIGGLLVAIVNHLFTRKKTEAEIEKLKAETEKIRSETKHAISEANYYDLTKPDEIVLYDGTRGIHGYDLYSSWADYAVQQGAIVIQSDESAFTLQRYIHDGKESKFIPKNELGSGERRFRVSCEMKVVRASYKVGIYIEAHREEEEESFGDREVTVTNPEWTKTDFYYRARSDIDCDVYVHAQRTTRDGSLQIRNIVVAERIR